MSDATGICGYCDAPLFADAAAWGGLTCGDCIAAQIQLSLMGGIPARDRKPARRAAGAPGELEVGDVTSERKSA